MHTFTVFTPTWRRASLLPRLYESLKKQTCKDFVWDVMYGKAGDDTLQVLENFQKEGAIDIRMTEHPDMPPLTWLARKYAFQNCTTPYLVFIDDDDELCPNALEVFLNNINKIKMIECVGGGKNLEIRGLSVDDNGVPVIGDRKLRENLFKPYDMSYIESNFKLTSMENLSCFDVEKVRRADVFHLGEYWLKGKVSFISEGIFWGRLSRQYLCRYIPDVLRLYHSGENTTRNFSESNIYSQLASGKIYLEEWYDYYRRYPIRYVRKLLSMCALTCLLGEEKLPYSELVSHIKHDKWLVRLMRPFGMLGAYWYRRKYHVK